MIQKENILAQEARKILLEGKPLINFYILGTLDLVGLKINQLIQIENCIIESLQSACVEYNQKVEIKTSEFKKCDFTFTYFIKGLKLEKCTFKDYLDFQCGGHTKTLNTFSIEGCVFKGFVNFLDCIYDGQVEIENNDFRMGTNLLGNIGESYQTSFLIQPKIERNKGKLTVDGEGDLKINSIIDT